MPVRTKPVVNTPLARITPTDAGAKRNRSTRRSVAVICISASRKSSVRHREIDTLQIQVQSDGGLVGKIDRRLSIESAFADRARERVERQHGAIGADLGP